MNIFTGSRLIRISHRARPLIDVPLDSPRDVILCRARGREFRRREAIGVRARHAGKSHQARKPFRLRALSGESAPQETAIATRATARLSCRGRELSRDGSRRSRLATDSSISSPAGQRYRRCRYCVDRYGTAAGVSHFDRVITSRRMKGQGHRESESRRRRRRDSACILELYHSESVRGTSCRYISPPIDMARYAGFSTLLLSIQESRVG
jgi:hypothetical protein